ncbi:hypothetical protein CCUS01_14149 [Colletotrichum cuscutae]|uniref:Uncharacterized protein n=1 Tax=Colletotrichum cuscutae TaxID=1209917 RepID=A0AAJ0DM73_9PEZI|nr:hypothetical protein CCUS01_14149 [Colletotrichum cuscutae]
MSRQLYLDNNCNVANSGSCCVVRVDDEPLVWCPGRPRSLEEGFVCLPQVLFGTLLVEPGCEVGHPQPTTVNSTTCPQILKIFPARMLLRTFQYPSHSNKLKPEAQQTTVRKVKSRAQQVPNYTRSNCPGEPSPLIPPKVQSPASSPESGYLLACPILQREVMYGVHPPPSRCHPCSSDTGTCRARYRSGCPSPSSPRAIALQGFHREILPESTPYEAQIPAGVDVEGLNLEGWPWLGIPPPLRIRCLLLLPSLLACSSICHASRFTAAHHHAAAVPRVPIPYPMCQVAQCLFDRL